MNDNECTSATPEMHGRHIRNTVVNLLRVMRGAGNPARILGDIEFMAKEAPQDNQGRVATTDAMAIAIQSWNEDTTTRIRGAFERGGESVEYAMACLEHGACRASLRLMAAIMSGNWIEESKAKSDLWSEVHRFIGARRAASEKEEVDDLKRLAVERKREAARDRRVADANHRALEAANDNDCYVYFVTDGEAIKIGKAINPKSRLGGLQTSHHKPLRILALMPGDEAVERRLHWKFEAYRIRGEWFRDCRPIRDFIRRLSPNDPETLPEANAA